METEDVGRSPRRNIISFRISDEELQSLTRLLKKRNTTISQLVRDALSPALLCPVKGREGGWPERGN